jgi:hypothetical protein
VRETITPVAALLTVAVLRAACASTRSVTVKPAQVQDAEQVEPDRGDCDAQARRQRDPAAVLVTMIATPIAGAALGATFGLMAVFASNTSIGSGDDTRRVVGPVAIGAAVGLEQAYLEHYAACLGTRGYWVTP